MIVIPSLSAPVLLDDLLDNVTTYFRLYVNDATLSADTVLDDLEEADFPGYAPYKVTTWSPSLWTTDRAESNADLVVWTQTGAAELAEVYGYFVTDGLTGPLLWCEARPQGPLTMHAIGAQVSVRPTLTLRQSPD